MTTLSPSAMASRRSRRCDIALSSAVNPASASWLTPNRPAVDLAAGHVANTRARWRPARSAEHVTELVPKTFRAAHVAADGSELVISDPERVVRRDVLRQPVLDAPHLWFEGAEELVPHDQDPAVVLVEVLLVRAMVDAVVRGRV